MQSIIPYPYIEETPPELHATMLENLPSRDLATISRSKTDVGLEATRILQQRRRELMTSLCVIPLSEQCYNRYAQAIIDDDEETAWMMLSLGLVNIDDKVPDLNVHPSGTLSTYVDPLTLAIWSGSIYTIGMLLDRGLEVDSYRGSVDDYLNQVTDAAAGFIDNGKPSDWPIIMDMILSSAPPKENRSRRKGPHPLEVLAGYYTYIPHPQWEEMVDVLFSNGYSLKNPVGTWPNSPTVLEFFQDYISRNGEDEGKTAVIDLWYKYLESQYEVLE